MYNYSHTIVYAVVIVVVVHCVLKFLDWAEKAKRGRKNEANKVGVNDEV